jgi:hypothetical protein
MLAKRNVSAIIIETMAMGALLTGLTVLAPDIYHDMHSSVAASNVVTVVSATTPSDSPDIYHDM